MSEEWSDEMIDEAAWQAAFIRAFAEDDEEECLNCDGTGDCPDCGGWDQDDEDCDSCNGTGECHECDGEGTVLPDSDDEIIVEGQASS